MNRRRRPDTEIVTEISERVRAELPLLAEHLRIWFEGGWCLASTDIVACFACRGYLRIRPGAVPRYVRLDTREVQC